MTPRETQVMVVQLSERLARLEDRIDALTPSNAPRPATPTAKPSNESRWLRYVKFPTSCAGCGHEILAGDQSPAVWYVPGPPKARIYHERCSVTR